MDDSNSFTGKLARNAYETIGLETQVLSASPERLITLLFEGARASIAQAHLHIQNNRIAEKGQAISKAIGIVDEGLKASLDLKAGGELASNLAELYSFVTKSLLIANLKSDESQLNIADRILSELQQAWKTSVDHPKQQENSAMTDSKV